LIALYLEGLSTSKRRERVAALRESSAVDGAMLQDVARRFNLRLE